MVIMLFRHIFKLFSQVGHHVLLEEAKDTLCTVPIWCCCRERSWNYRNKRQCKHYPQLSADLGFIRWYPRINPFLPDLDRIQTSSDMDRIRTTPNLDKIRTSSDPDGSYFSTDLFENLWIDTFYPALKKNRFFEENEKSCHFVPKIQSCIKMNFF